MFKCPKCGRDHRDSTYECYCGEKLPLEGDEDVSEYQSEEYTSSSSWTDLGCGSTVAILILCVTVYKIAELYFSSRH